MFILLDTAFAKKIALFIAYKYASYAIGKKINIKLFYFESKKLDLRMMSFYMVSVVYYFSAQTNRLILLKFGMKG